MKKRFKKLLLVLVCGLYALTCSSCASGNADPTPGEPMVVQLPEIPQRTIQQEETTELRIWMEGDISRWVKAFNEVYPEIHVTVESPCAVLGGTYPHLPKSLADGTGEYEYPDVVYVSNYLYVYQWQEKRQEAFADIYKLMDSGALLDMTEFMENDPEFDQSQYDQKALECGKYRGGQYLLPESVGSNFKTLIGRSDKLEQIGFEQNAFEGADKLLSELTRVRKEMGMKSTLAHLGYCSKEELIFQACAPDLVDFDNGNVLPNEERFLKFCLSWKNFFYGDQRERENIYNQTVEEKSMEYQVINGQTVFAVDNNTGIKEYNDLSLNSSSIMRGIPDMNGDIIGEGINNFGICSWGKNHQNAWKFIEFVLSNPEIDSGTTPTLLSSQNEALESLIKWGRNRENYNLNLEEEEKFKEAANNFDRYRFSSTKLFELFTENMEPFFRDESDYGTCAAGLKSSLKDYLLG